MYSDTTSPNISSRQGNATNPNPDKSISGSVDDNNSGEGGAPTKLTAFPSDVGQGSIGASGTDFAKH